MMEMAIGVLAAATLAGALLFMRGWRGRRINDHPLCGRCGFDLIGTVKSQLGAGLEICPECGADLLERGVVQHGLRERRRVLIAAGVVLLLAGVLGWITLATGRLSNVNWNQYKPTWMLVWEAKGASTPDEAVLKELMGRRAGMEVGPGVYRELVEHALARQLNDKLGWSAVWGDLVEDANLRGDISAGTYQQFYANGVVVELSVGDKAVVGEGVPFTIECIGMKLGASSTVCLSIGEMVATVQVDEGPSVNRFDTGWGSSSGGGSSRTSMGMQVPLQTVIPAGKRAGTISVAYRVSKAWKSAPVRSGVVEVSKVLEFVEGAERAVVMKADESQRAALLAWFKSTRIKHDLRRSSTGHLQLTMGGDKLPVNVSFKVTARETMADGSIKDWAFPDMAISKGSNGTSSHDLAPRGFGAKKVTLVLKADPAPASRISGMKEVWEGDLEVPDVVVEPIYPEPGADGGDVPRK